ncbi:MAG: glycosyltransferase family 4 protein [Acidimicrobiales bacterium]
MSRVALLSPYSLGVPGGVQEQVLAMSRELARRGHEVLVVAPDAADHATYDTPARLVRVGALVSMPANGSRAPLTLSPRAPGAARRAVAAFAPDVVHLHEPFAPLAGWGVLRAHAAPSVGTFHRAGAGPALTLTRPLLRAFARHLDEAAAVSDAAARTIHAATGLTPTVLFNGFEVERFVEYPRERRAEIEVLFVGRLEDRKGAAVALEAVRTHNEGDGAPWRLVVIGDGPQRARLEARAAREHRVRFLGAVDDEAKRRWLRRAAVVVAPSTHGESFGMTLLEAMASETPVVASDIDGYREAAGGHATLVAPGDPVDLEAGIAAALAASSASITAAREHAARWSMRRLMDEYEAIYARAGERFATRR